MVGGFSSDGLPKVVRRGSQRAPAGSVRPPHPDDDDDLERRSRQPRDAWSTWAAVLTACSGACAGLGVILAGMSSPPSHFAFFDRTFGVPSRSGWNEDGLTYAAVAACLCFAFAVGALVLRSQRLRRDGDRPPVALVGLMVASLIAVALYFFAGPG